MDECDGREIMIVNIFVRYVKMKMKYKRGQEDRGVRLLAEAVSPWLGWLPRARRWISTAPTSRSTSPWSRSGRPPRSSACVYSWVTLFCSFSRFLLGNSWRARFLDGALIVLWFRRDLLDISPTLKEAAGAIVDVSSSLSLSLY